jgi:chorismate-pyruvate lyase
MVAMKNRGESGMEVPKVLHWLKKENIPPLLRTLMVSDGTVTRFLEAYYGEKVEVKILSHRNDSLIEALPELDSLMGDILLHRKISLQGCDSNRVYGEARSWIRIDHLAKELREDLEKGRVGIGGLLDDRRVESYREILRCGYEEGSEKEERKVCRLYRIWIQSRPTLLIEETFPIELFRGYGLKQ